MSAKASEIRVVPACQRQVQSGFEAMYRHEVRVISAFFARRTTDPQTVADLTSETFARALGSLHTYDARGSERAWLFAIARIVYARHQAEIINGREVVLRLARRVALQEPDLADLIDRIDAQAQGRELLCIAAALPELERAAIELVDIAGMSSADAARSLGISPGAMRVRLFRARSHLRKEGRHE
jgi:RNA polymerase sigma factor (sigma-70 family)